MGSAVCNANDARFDLGWWTERVARDLHDVIDLGVELDVGRETTPKIVTWAGNESQSKFTLEHENGATEEGTMRQQLEDER